MANLYTVPKKDKVRPHIQIWIADAVYQADLIIMPEGPKGYKCILMCVDLATRKVDGQPLKLEMLKQFYKALRLFLKESI